MKVRPRWIRSLFLMVVVAAITAPAWVPVWVTAEDPPRRPTPAPPALPPLELDDSAPLLLDKPDLKKTAAGSHADNSACYVCHANYQKESLAQWHAEESIGCVDCHGDSFAHRNDENNTTPPEVMFPKDRIDTACQECHETHDVPAGEVVARFLKRCPHDADPEMVVCTECHGWHRLKVRTVIWDKGTGELIGTLEKK